MRCMCVGFSKSSSLSAALPPCLAKRSARSHSIVWSQCNFLLLLHTFCNTRMFVPCSYPHDNIFSTNSQKWAMKPDRHSGTTHGGPVLIRLFYFYAWYRWAWWQDNDTTDSFTPYICFLSCLSTTSAEILFSILFLKYYLHSEMKEWGRVNAYWKQ